MKTLKRLGAAIALTFVFAFAALADCPPPDPGIMNAPPCSSAQITPDDPVVSTEPTESSASGSAAIVEITESTIDVLLSALSIF